MQTYTNKQVSGVCLPANTTAVNRDNHTWGFTNQTNRWLRRVNGAIALSLAMSMLAATQALAGSFSITKITDTQSEFTSISNKGAAINDNGTIAFIASPKVEQLGIYTSSDSKITEIINQSRLASLYGLTLNPGLIFSFESVENINNKGSVAFIATQSNGGGAVDKRIFSSQDGSLTTRAKVSYNGRYGPVTLITDLNNQDELAYLNINRSFSSSGPYGTTTLVLTKDNQPDVTIASASINPSSPANTPFSSIDAFAFNNVGEVTFAATRSDRTAAIFTQHDDGPTSIVETNASALATNDKGDLVLSSGDAIRSFDHTTSTLSTIADPTNSSLKAFSNLAINNNNNVAFTATLNSGEKGIFTGADPVADKVIATGDSLAGSTVTNLNFLRSGLNNNNQIAFSVQLADGTQGIFRAEPVTQTPPPQPGPSVEDAFALSKIVDTLTPIPGGVGNFTYLNSVLIDGDNVVFDGSSYTSTLSQPGIYKSSGGILSTITDKNTPIPNGSGTFTNFSLDSIDDGNVLFRGSGTNLQGIYIKRGETPLSVVVDNNTLIPGGTENFSSFYGLVRGQNNVAFSAKGASGQGGIYILQDGSLQVVADRNTPIPGGTGNFDRFGSLALDENNVAFQGYGAGSDQRGIYISRNGSLQVVADRNTPIPGGTGNFDNFGSLALAENNVVFNSYDSSYSVQGIYILQDGSLQVVADRNTPIPGGTGNFKSFSSTPPSVLDKKNVVFQAEDANGQQGLYIRRDGALQVLVDTNTTIPGSTIKFKNFSFSDPVVDGKNVAFVARVGDIAGIYAKVGDSLLKVADLSSRVDGKRISSLSSIALKGNSLAFSATFTDGTIAIVRADLSPHK